MSEARSLSRARRPMTAARFRLWLTAGFVVLFLVAAVASTGPGITWDEPSYVAAGYGYWTWLGKLSAGSFSGDGIDEYWTANHEHPPAAKLVYGLAGVLERGNDLRAYATARLLAAAMFVALAALVYWFVAVEFGRTAGVLAALALVLMPRVFGHGHLAALDVPVALACFAATAAFSRGRVSARRGAGTGALWGVALLTKINAVFLPVVLVPWAVAYQRRRAVLPCLLFVAVGGATFVAGWPWLWRETSARVSAYVLNKAERLEGEDRPTGTTNVPVHYLGRTYRERVAPWHYPAVMTLATVPAGLLALAAVGAKKSLGEKGHRRAGALILAGFLLPVAVLALPTVPKYDGVRLFLMAFPFLACLAGIGGAAVWAWRGWIGKGVVIAVFVVNAAVLALTHPYELSYYNCLVGGAWGASRLGFETTYWGDTVTREVMESVNEVCPDGSSVAVWPRYQAFVGTLPWMKAELVWRKTWKPGDPPPDYLILFPRQGYLDEFTWKLVREGHPVRAWKYMGVPQCMLFRLK